MSDQSLHAQLIETRNTLLLANERILGLMKNQDAIRSELHAMKMVLLWVVNSLSQDQQMQNLLREKLTELHKDSDQSQRHEVSATLKLFLDALGKEPPKPPQLYLVPTPKD